MSLKKRKSNSRCGSEGLSLIGHSVTAATKDSLFKRSWHDTRVATKQMKGHRSKCHRSTIIMYYNDMDLCQGCIYVENYPVLKTAQNALLPGRPVQPNTIFIYLGSIQPSQN